MKKRQLVKRRRFSGLRVLYRLTLAEEPEGYAYIEILARSKAGERYERSGALPIGRREAIAFFKSIVKGRVTPFGLLAIYDDFIYDITETKV